MQNKYWVYKLTSPSGRVYIGITSNIIKRFAFYKNHHLLKQTAIYNSIAKYGWDSHIKEILYISLEKEEAEEKEIELIKFYKEQKKCLNLTDGGLICPQKETNPKSKIVYQYDLDGNFIKEWESIFSIEMDTEFNATNIGKVCRKRSYYQYGYLWSFKEDVEKGIIPYYIKKPGNRRRELLLLNNKGEIIKTFQSVKEAINTCKLKNPKRNILKSIRKKIPDVNGNYWKYKKQEYE